MQINSFEMLGRMLPMLVTSPAYAEQSFENLGTRILLAVEYGKIRYYMRDDQLVGFVTWAYLSKEESETCEYKWVDIYSREHGEELWVMDMVALDSVVYIAKDIRRYLSDTTNHSIAYWRRPKSRNRKLGKAWRLR